MRIRSRATWLSFVAALVGCGEYPRSHPMAANAACTIEIVGPDTARSVNGILRYEARTVPAWPYDPPVWTSNSPIVLSNLGGGAFRVIGIDLYAPGPIIRVRF